MNKRNGITQRQTNLKRSLSSRMLRAQRGQAIVLIALMLVALIGMLGMAVDGGGLFFLYRATQNASDAAVVSATYALCTNANEDDIRAAGLAAARANGFTNDGVNNTVTVNYPPTSGRSSGDTDFVEVLISANKPPYFIQVVYQGPLTVTSRAVGYCESAFDPSTVPPIWAGSQTCSDTVNWTGSGSYVEGGIFSNNEIKFGGGGQGNEIIGPTEAVTTVQTSASGNATFSPDPVTGVDVQLDPLSHYRLTDFAPGGSVAVRAERYSAISSSADDPDFRDGQNVWALNGTNRTLEGLYYVEGDVVLGTNVNFSPVGVTIVATGQISGSGGVSLKYYIDGILFMSGHESRNCGENGVSVSGNRSTWLGVLYAPRAGVNISGSNLSIYGALIGDTIDISGSSLRLIADPDIIPPRPPLVQVVE